MFKVFLSTRAKKELVPAKQFDVKKLEGLDNTFRIRIGKLRIVYAVDWKNKDIVIAKIGMRENIYG